MKKLGRQRDAGFTLIELLVVLVILGLLAAIVGPQLLKYVGSSRTQTAKVQIQNVVAGLELFRLDAGRYPSEQEGLNALLTAPSNMPTWNGPYLRRPDAIRDPWGQPYLYSNPGKHGEVDVYSLGSDKAAGGSGEAQDVGSW